jgi:hypothetical protein
MVRLVGGLVAWVDGAGELPANFDHFQDIGRRKARRRDRRQIAYADKVFLP